MSREEKRKFSVAFVCLGNICRSPMAEAVFRHTVISKGHEDLFDKIDSFGTGAYHAGEQPDRRSARTCRDHGVKVDHRAQQIWPQNFDKFDYLLAMDESNYEDLMEMKPRNSRAQVKLFGDYSVDPKFSKVVSDPYYGGTKGFEDNFVQVEHFSNQLLMALVDESRKPLSQ